jgi:hypothetical protein
MAEDTSVAANPDRDQPQTRAFNWPAQSFERQSGRKLRNEADFRKRRPMTSLKQIEANRRNALNSTGPKTEAGKQQSRRNALRHGLTAEMFFGIFREPLNFAKCAL